MELILEKDEAIVSVKGNIVSVHFDGEDIELSKKEAIELGFITESSKKSITDIVSPWDAKILSKKYVGNDVFGGELSLVNDLDAGEFNVLFIDSHRGKLYGETFSNLNKAKQFYNRTLSRLQSDAVGGTWGSSTLKGISSLGDLNAYLNEALFAPKGHTEKSKKAARGDIKEGTILEKDEEFFVVTESTLDYVTIVNSDGIELNISESSLSKSGYSVISEATQPSGNKWTDIIKELDARYGIPAVELSNGGLLANGIDEIKAVFKGNVRGWTLDINGNHYTCRPSTYAIASCIAKNCTPLDVDNEGVQTTDVAKGNKIQDLNKDEE